eukprot:11849682-Heterocapsa_arctica.AAC.1
MRISGADGKRHPEPTSRQKTALGGYRHMNQRDQGKFPKRTALAITEPMPLPIRRQKEQGPHWDKESSMPTGRTCALMSKKRRNSS